MVTSHPEQHLPGPARAGTVTAPGARLHVRARGSGPCLMMLSGGAADANGFDAVAPYLTGGYTVVTYDRRGLSRSLLDDPDQDPAITIATHSEDVHRILTSLGAAPALVFGSSIGALIGLDLLIRHAEDVRLLVAHEPPIASLAARAAKPAASLAEIYARTGDADETMRRFAASLIPKHLLPLASDRRDSASRSANNEFFLRNDAPAARRYELDLDALKGLTSRLVVAGGRDGREFAPYASASRLATRLGISLTEFPGNHAGFAIYPAEFAQSLRQALVTASSPGVSLRRSVCGGRSRDQAPDRQAPDRRQQLDHTMRHACLAARLSAPGTAPTQASAAGRFTASARRPRLTGATACSRLTMTPSSTRRRAAPVWPGACCLGGQAPERHARARECGTGPRRTRGPVPAVK